MGFGLIGRIESPIHFHLLHIPMHTGQMPLIEPEPKRLLLLSPFPTVAW